MLAPPKKEEAGELTLALMPGKKHKVWLYGPTKEKDGKFKPAKRLADEPHGWLDLPNGVRIVVQGPLVAPTGQLYTVAKATLEGARRTRRIAAAERSALRGRAVPTGHLQGRGAESFGAPAGSTARPPPARLEGGARRGWSIAGVGSRSWRSPGSRRAARSGSTRPRPACGRASTGKGRVEVVNAYTRGDRLVLLSRAEDGELEETQQKAEWSFFLRAEDMSPEQHRALRAERDCWVRPEGEWLRVGCSRWLGRREKVGRIQASWGLEVHEGDVSPVKRAFADQGDLTIGTPRRCYLDLETDSRLPFVRKKEMRILVWCVTDDSCRVVGCGALDEDHDASERQPPPGPGASARPVRPGRWRGTGSRSTSRSCEARREATGRAARAPALGLARPDGAVSGG